MASAESPRVLVRIRQQGRAELGGRYRGGLAAHPLSSHPQRCLANEKMKEKGKENGSLFNKLPSNFNNEKLDTYTVLFGTYISPKTIQITKINKSSKLL